ncbi:hypothetical protein PMIN04_006512 [Paraphaeosphaeria minitans]
MYSPIFAESIYLMYSPIFAESIYLMYSPMFATVCPMCNPIFATVYLMYSPPWQTAHGYMAASTACMLNILAPSTVRPVVGLASRRQPPSLLYCIARYTPVRIASRAAARPASGISTTLVKGRPEADQAVLLSSFTVFFSRSLLTDC